MATENDVQVSRQLEATKQKIEQDRRERIARHKQAIAEQLSRVRDEDFAAPGASRLNIFAEGDSWFDYPFLNDVIDCIRNAGRPTPEILSLAHYGDVTTNMLGVENRQRIVDMLTDCDNGDFDALLFSGGGNDLVGDQFCLWVKDYVAGIDPSNGVQRERLANILGVVESAYIDLFQIRDRLASECVVFVHAYDFAQPTGKGVCSVGPWLKPSLDYRQWTGYAQAAAVVKEVLLEFHSLLLRLEQSHRNVVYVRTQGTLNANMDWGNELHPNEQGFQKIGGVFLAALRHRFPGRI